MSPLRIAYLTEWPPYAETGVLRKLIGQVAAWRELGSAAQLFSIAPRREERPVLAFDDYGMVIGRIDQRRLDEYPFARLGYFNKILSIGLLVRALRAFRPDVIYYRQTGPWYPGLVQLLGLAPTVMEINTDEDIEHKLWGTAFNSLYRSTQGRVLARAAGFLAVTHEIAAKYERFGMPVAVVANSFWGDALGDVPAARNAEPAFVFVGSRLTSGASWHGVDKILPLARALPASTFHIVGHTAEDFPGESIPSNAVLHGFKTGRELSDIFLASDVGIGTLALHRKGMDEACPLKVRDYLMHRLPVVIAFRETEDRLNTADYVLALPNTQDNVETSVKQIVDFARRWHGRRVADNLEFMSRTAKEQERLAFLAAVAASATPRREDL